MWLKRYDKQWSWITAVLDEDNHLGHFYLNGTEVDSKVGLGSPSPLRFDGKLKNYPLVYFLSRYLTKKIVFFHILIWSTLVFLFL